jgi:isoleucyl-tRNA synthetase
MQVVQKAVSLGHSLRKENKVKVRQPLAKVIVASSNEKLIHFLQDQQHLIADELNVKNVEFTSEETKFVTLRAKPNFRVLGKKAGKLMKPLHEAISQLTKKELEMLLEGNNLTIDVAGEKIELTPEDVAVDRIVLEGNAAASQEDITIVLDLHLDDELLMEGLAREIVNKVNTMRKDAGFDVSDRIEVAIDTSDKVRACFEKFQDYICHEILAVKVEFKSAVGEVLDLNGEPAKIELKKVQTPLSKKPLIR